MFIVNTVEHLPFKPLMSSYPLVSFKHLGRETRSFVMLCTAISSGNRDALHDCFLETLFSMRKQTNKTTLCNVKASLLLRDSIFVNFYQNNSWLLTRAILIVAIHLLNKETTGTIQKLPEHFGYSFKKKHINKNIAFLRTSFRTCPPPNT